MDTIDITTDWLTTKPIESCLFVKFITGDEISGQNTSDSEPNEDIETLLESYENCIKFLEPHPDSKDGSIDCKLFIKTRDESEDQSMARIVSFSMLCSAKIVEIHGNEFKEYMKTLFNELIDEADGLPMYRSDYHFSEPQKEMTITLKSFNELWIYGLVIKLIRVKRKPVMVSPEVNNFATIFSMISMFSNASKSSSSADLTQRLSKLKTSDENIAKSNERINSIEKRALKSDPIVTTDEDNYQISDELKSDLSKEQMCECFCHKTDVSQQNTQFLCRYIDQKVSDLEKSIENKFNSLENKMFSALNLFINKQ